MARSFVSMDRKLVVALGLLALLPFLFHAHAPFPKVTSAEAGQERAAAPHVFLFLSPNTDEDLPLEEAIRRLQSPRQQQFRKLAARLMDAIEADGPSACDAMGDWSDGVENSILVTASSPPPVQALRYAAARFGMAAEQKAVLLFVAGDGPDAVYEFEPAERDLGKLRQTLDAYGIPFRTLIPVPDGWRVIVYDEGGTLRPNVLRLGMPLRETRGRGESLGQETREAARQSFQTLIRTYEDGPRAPRSRPSLGTAAPAPI